MQTKLRLSLGPSYRPRSRPRKKPGPKKALPQPARQAWVFSDAARLADWQGAVVRHRPTGIILRDYRAKDRAAQAADMRAFLATMRRPTAFSIAGDARLARRHKASFHCPSHLVVQPSRRLARATRRDSAAVHTMRQLLSAKRAGFGRVFISPIFATASHPEARALGPLRARQLALAARRFGLAPLALGGMSGRALRRLNGADSPQACAFIGYGAIAAFGEQ